ncbi:hypothetical protein TWF281_011667 [Arthrobotrys megalospora]
MKNTMPSDHLKRKSSLINAIKSMTEAREHLLDKTISEMKPKPLLDLPSEILLDIVDKLTLADAKTFSFVSRTCRGLSIWRIFTRISYENRPALERMGRDNWANFVEHHSKYTKSVLLKADVRFRAGLSAGSNVGNPERPMFDIGFVEALQPFKNLRSLEIYDMVGLNWLGFLDAISHILSDKLSLKTLGISPCLEHLWIETLPSGQDLDFPFPLSDIKPIAVKHAKLEKLVVRFKDQRIGNEQVSNFLKFLRFCEPALETATEFEILLSKSFQRWFGEKMADDEVPALINLPALTKLTVLCPSIPEVIAIPVSSTSLGSVKSVTLPYLPEDPECALELLSFCPAATDINVIWQFSPTLVYRRYWGYIAESGTIEAFEEYAKQLWQFHRNLKTIKLYRNTSFDLSVARFRCRYDYVPTSDGVRLWTDQDIQLLP